MKTQFRRLTGNLALLLVVPIFYASAQAEGRWYDDATLEKGVTIFAENCASCHGANAEATADWKKTDSNGKYPPPPLNGTAHAWHHSIEVLKETIQNGGIKLGGLMPPFKDKLSDKDIDAVIAFFQSKWPDELYQKWAGRYQSSDIPPITNVVESLEKATAKNKMTDLLKLRLGLASNKVSEPVETPVEGIYQTQFGNNYGYLTEDGRYLFLGSLIDLKQGQNLTDIDKRKTVKSEISRLAIGDKAVFPAMGEEKAVLNVFTDTSCPYCKKLHEEVSKLQEAGISVHYIPYPRGSSKGPGYQKLKQVWCAQDKALALTIGKGLATGDLPAGDCEDSKLVDEGYALGNKVGVTGTPALYKSSGEMITGYVPYKELIPMVFNN